MRDEVGEAAPEALLMVGVDGFDMSDPAITEFIENRSRIVGEKVNAETDKQLRATLAEGINAGESFDELAARVEQVYGAAAGYRAERIARTETIRAESFASQVAWQQSGLVSAKEWYVSHDDRLCPFCRPMDGKIVGLDKSYYKQGTSLTVPQLDNEGNPVLDDDGNEKTTTIKLDFDDIDGPPLHANCRCTLLPVLIND